MSSYEQLHALARVILPEEIVDNFDLVGIEEKSGVSHIRLDEQSVCPVGFTADSVSPNGFFPSSSVFDFPIRDHKVILHIRRRRWVEKDTDKSLSRSWEITAKGTRYTVSFAAFLKEVFGYDPVPTNSLERYYHIDGDQLERHYKEHLSHYLEWEQREHADKWLLFPENMGTQR